MQDLSDRDRAAVFGEQSDQRKSVTPLETSPQRSNQFGYALNWAEQLQRNHCIPVSYLRASNGQFRKFQALHLNGMPNKWASNGRFQTLHSSFSPQLMNWAFQLELFDPFNVNCLNLPVWPFQLWKTYELECLILSMWIIGTFQFEHVNYVMLTDWIVSCVCLSV